MAESSRSTRGGRVPQHDGATVGLGTTADADQHAESGCVDELDVPQIEHEVLVVRVERVVQRRPHQRTRSRRPDAPAT